MAKRQSPTEKKLRQIAEDCGLKYVGRDDNDGYPRMLSGLDLAPQGFLFRLYEEAYGERKMLAFLRKLATAVTKADLEK